MPGPGLRSQSFMGESKSVQSIAIAGSFVEQGVVGVERVGVHRLFLEQGFAELELHHLERSRLEVVLRPTRAPLPPPCRGGSVRRNRRQTAVGRAAPSPPRRWSGSAWRRTPFRRPRRIVPRRRTAPLCRAAGRVFVARARPPPARGALAKASSSSSGRSLAQSWSRAANSAWAGIDADAAWPRPPLFPARPIHVLEAGGRQVFTQVRLDAGDLVGVVCHGEESGLGLAKRRREQALNRHGCQTTKPSRLASRAFLIHLAKRIWP